MKSAIVSGANGFIGSKLVKELSEGSYKVWAIVKDENENIEDIVNLDGVNIVYCDMSEYETLKSKIPEKDIDIFYHLAWMGVSGEVRSDHQLQLDNAAYTCRAYLSAVDMGISKFIYAASLMEYDVMKQFQVDSTKLKRNQHYGIGKLSAHLMLISLANNSPTALCAALISNVYGPGENTPRLVNSTIRMLLKEKSTPFTHGRQLCDFIYIDDVCRGLKLIGEKGSRDYYYLGSCRIMPLRRYIKLFKYIDPNVELRLGEIPFDGESLTYSEFDINRLYFDTGFETEVSFEEGIQRTAEWIRETEMSG